MFAVAIPVVYCWVFGLLLQLAAEIDHAVSKEPNSFAPEQNEGIPLYDGESLIVMIGGRAGERVEGFGCSENE